MVSPIEWGIFNVVLTLVVGVTLIYTSFYTSRWLFRDLTEQIQVAFKSAAGLADEDARLAKEYRTLLAAFSSFALERPKVGTTEADPTTLRCVRIVPDKEGLSVVFEGFEIHHNTVYSGFRLFYRGLDVSDLRFRHGDQPVFRGDRLCITYTIGSEGLKARVDGDKPAMEGSDNPMWDEGLDLGDDTK